MKAGHWTQGALCWAFIATPTAGLASEPGAAPVMEELVVTAERRESDVQETAISASVMSGEQLEEKGVVDLYTIQYAAPSMTIAHFGSANEFNIRGIGRTQVDIDVPSGVVIYRDGAPTIAGYFQTEPYYDLKSVEVLRGPQGTFVGKNAAGGAVFINTNDPDPSQFSASVEAGLGNFGLWEVTGIVNVPVTDTLAIRASYRHLDSDDFYDSLSGNYTGHPASRDLDSYRFAVEWAPTEALVGSLKVDYHDLDFGGNVVSSPGFPIYDVEQNGDIAYEDQSLRVVGNIAYEFANGLTLNSISAYQDLDSLNNLDLNGSLPVFSQFKSNFSVDIITQELTLISPADQTVRWILGAFYFEQNVDVPDWTKDGFTFTGDVFFSGGGATDYPWLTTPWDKHEDEWSLFGHAAYDLAEQWEIEAGVRYTKYATDQTTDYRFGLGDAPPVDVFAAGTQDLDESSVDGQVALNYQMSDEHFLYALFSRGHVTSGINIFPPYRQYDEMEVRNYELGWKARWQDDAIRTQATLYLLDFDNYQVNFESPDIAIGQDNRNAPGDSQIKGVELSAQAHVDNWYADLAFAYMMSDIGNFDGVIDPFTGEEVSLSGNRTPYSPKVTFNVGLAYLRLTPRVDVSYVSDTQSKLWDTPLVEIEQRTIVNGRLVLAAPDDRWSVTGWITNALDEKYVAGIQNLATLYYAGRPREYGVTFKYNVN